MGIENLHDRLESAKDSLDLGRGAMKNALASKQEIVNGFMGALAATAGLRAHLGTVEDGTEDMDGYFIMSRDSHQEGLRTLMNVMESTSNDSGTQAVRAAGRSTGILSGTATVEGRNLPRDVAMLREKTSAIGSLLSQLETALNEGQALAEHCGQDIKGVISGTDAAVVAATKYQQGL